MTDRTNKWQFWVDRGGTFTDLVGRAPDGQLVTTKLLSEKPESYADAAIEGIRRLMDVRDFPAGSIDAVKMGTTVATNALLERKGTPTLLLITEGFADLLRIGTQARPRLFDLAIRLPQAIYAQVAELPERLAADGTVLKALDEDATRAALQSAYDDGLRSVAIAGMHGYLNPDHELRAAEIAKEVGFTQITPSHQASALIKLVSRGDTAVIDAYLSPVLRRYVDQVASALDLGEGGACERLFFMQSSGGLTDAALFQGRDAILSGPAGGVVGMVRTAEAAGFDRLIGFDMGGTSTDVCHYAGAYERSFETEVAGARMRAPMMDIHTVAAGGGSILNFREGRYQVGPESAGADPGPACYRRGGPLTVTDCNVMLGKLSPAHFPAVFGPDGDEPLDADIVREKFEALAQEIASATGQPALSPEDTAAGFLRIAVQNMAQAIKKISVERGYDVTRYTLNCFGGAGGQHACLVADALGMKSVFVHPYAGVLSAFGMGLADIRATREAQFGQPLDNTADAKTRIDAMAQEAQAEVAKQGIDAGQIRTEARAHLRYKGSHQTLDIPFGTAKEMHRAFNDLHSTRFGFASPDRDLLIEMLTVEAIGETDDAQAPAPEGRADFAPAATLPVVMNGETHDAPLYVRDDLPAGASVDGPAIITESTGTNVIEPGWSARIDAAGNLILDRTQARARETALGTEADPILLEVFNNLFMSIAEQMGATLRNTAYSVNIKERLDFSCALFDAEGNLVANAPHVPVHLGSMSDSVRTVARLNAGNIRPGDAYMLNNPFNGGTHLPDVTVITPVFDKAGEEILFWVGSRGHHADIGGRTPGSAPPDSRHIEEEGVVIDNFLLVRGGKLLEEETRALLGSGRYPCRNVNDNLADLEAQVAANSTGIAEVNRMIDTFGRETVLAYMAHVQANAEASVRHVIGSLRDGDCTYPLDDGSQIRVKITVDREAGEATLDFTGTSDQHPMNYNAPRSITMAVTLYVFRTLVGRDIPMNEGCLKPLRLILPEGSMINPVHPAAVISGNTEVSQAIADCLFGALGVIAGSQGTMNNFVWGNARFQNYETIAGGTGAGPEFDGASGVHSHMTNTLMTDPEVLETRFPVRVERMAIRKGSGGDGRHHGGDGIHRIVRFLDDVTVTTLSSHRKVPPPGGDGGAPGACGENAVLRGDGSREVVPGNSESSLKAGDAFEMLTPGGGGWGTGGSR
ncbi:5-oxoprolinase [Oceanicola sp. 22II-s10i]|uniref:hydantoinase B/oxoprolinase family protein n=1 Tax=Oceanicola sp. 22II-s10i TaxID=1317116 RepID=UPI000B52545D|nr:hydantoinase B/oxoprolinase family protein [Oceanicola sp. 22II-s10i]OWU85651.1 5-oxoprolinase [Oceanicola sp. 22II-s10i]